MPRLKIFRIFTVCLKVWWEHQHTSILHNTTYMLVFSGFLKTNDRAVSEIEMIMSGRVCVCVSLKERVEYRWND